MILSDVNRYLRERGRANTSDIATHFGVAPEAVEGMLQMLEARGRVRALPAETSPCGSSCCSCSISKCASQMWETMQRH
ncbi:FeoC-like transcriptional regulator [uncultured Cohaesibacter sp.]|uniref:FeoC-like transcriptional regulator n=1 Tax=uncultured Cohaesibacter sp. TaxID=1002546 RepID=UPI002A0A158C|nr:FeoC-like transcriptional regulator [uncultured Cohaesibacter sp.]